MLWSKWIEFLCSCRVPSISSFKDLSTDGCDRAAAVIICAYFTQLHTLCTQYYNVQNISVPFYTEVHNIREGVKKFLQNPDYHKLWSIICIICPKPKRRARGHAARAVTVLVPPLTARPLSAASAEWNGFTDLTGEAPSPFRAENFDLLQRAATRQAPLAAPALLPDPTPAGALAPPWP